MKKMIYRDDRIATLRRILRQVFADYRASEGCSCCEATEEHEAALEKIANLLNVPRYADGSGWDFYRYRKEQQK